MWTETPAARQALAIVAVFNLVGFVVTNRVHMVLYFAMIAAGLHLLSQQLGAILLVALAIVNFLAFAGSRGLEAFDTKNGKDKRKDIIDIDKSKDTNTHDANKTTSNTNNNDKPTDPDPPDGRRAGAAGRSRDHRPKNDVAKTATSTSASSSTAEEDTADPNHKQGFESGRRKAGGAKYSIDYASTIEDAYDELNSILGSDGIGRLTQDTQHLMKQQMQLAQAMQGMAPMIKQIAPMVNSLQGMMGQMDKGQDQLVAAARSVQPTG